MTRPSLVVRSPLPTGAPGGSPVPDPEPKTGCLRRPGRACSHRCWRGQRARVRVRVRLQREPVRPAAVRSWGRHIRRCCLRSRRVHRGTDVVRNDLGAVTIHAFLGLPFAGLKAAFHEELLALAAVLGHVFRGAAKGHHRVPLGVVVPVAVPILASIGGCEAKIGHGSTAGGRPHFWILSEIADEKDFVDHNCSQGGNEVGKDVVPDEMCVSRIGGTVS